MNLPMNNLAEKATSRLPIDASIGWLATWTTDLRPSVLKLTMFNSSGSNTARRLGAVLFNSSRTQCSNKAGSVVQ